MKFIIIGLGTFGSALAVSLTETGHEVMGVDIDETRVEALKEQVTHVITLDATDVNMVKELPLKDTDTVVVCIGKNMGGNIMASALMKQLKVNNLACRSISQIHQTVLEAMQVDTVINPEAEAAERWAKKLSMKGVRDAYHIAGPYNIVEVKIPQKMFEKTMEELKLKEDYNIMVLTTMALRSKQNIMGIKTDDVIVHKMAGKETKLNEEEVMIVYGNIRDIKKMIRDYS